MTIDLNLSHFLTASAISFDLSDWSQVEMSGTDARTFLNNFCTNNIQQLSDGQACEAFACDIKGKILAHFLVLAADDKLRLIGVPGTAEVLCPHLKKYQLDANVEIIDRSSELGLLCLYGTGLSDVLETALGKRISLESHQCQTITMSGEHLLLIGTDIAPAPAMLVSGERELVAALREKIPSSFMELGTPELFEVLRLAAGFPWYGRDLTSADLAQMAGRTSQAISFTKGCYLGQEPIARLDAMGHTNFEVRGLVIESSHVDLGAIVKADEKEIGTVTSISPLPDDHVSIAMAKIRTTHAEPGSQLSVLTSEGPVPATVFWHTPER